MMSKNNISIRKIIIVTFVFSIVASTSFIGEMVFSNWISSINKITDKMAKDINMDISKQINSFMNVPKHINEVNEKIIQSGLVNFSNEAERDRYFVEVLQTHMDEIYSFTYGMENGEYYGARRNENGEIQIVVNNSSTGGSSWYYYVNDDFTRGELALKTDKFDVRTRDWYKAAKMSGESTFSPIYKHFVMDDLTVSSATPIYASDGKLLGVLGTHMVLSNINNYVSETIKAYDGYALVLEKDSDTLIANSFGSKNFTVLEDGSLKRNKISELNNELITGIFQQYSNGAENDFQFVYEKTGYYVNALNYQNEGLDWIVISSIPNNLFTQEIYDNMGLTAIVIVLTILFVVALYFFIIKWVFKPIDNLILVSNEIAIGNLATRATVVRYDEIGKLSNAFNFMADKMFHLVNNLEQKVKERTAELEVANEELNRIKEDLYLILDTTAEGIFGINMEGKCIFCNDSCVKLLGYSCQEDILGKNVHNIIHYNKSDGSHIPQEDCKILKSILENKKLYVVDEAFWKADGTKIDVEYHSYPKLKNGTVTGAVVTFIDITEKKKDEEQIKYLSDHDSLTGLLNRRCFEYHLKQKDKSAFFPLSIIFGDLNGLKLMNDVFGHVAGDKLIQKTAQVLKKACREDDSIARVGGDEFMILLPKTDADGTIKIMERIRTEMEKEKVFDIKCSIAIGFDTKVDSSQDVEKVMGNAEREMYKEKLLSKKNYSINTIQSILTTLHGRYPSEKVHSERVAELCDKMGKAIGLNEHELKRLRDVWYMHDIGKIVLDEEILKKEELNDNERHQIEQHPVVGYRILNLFDSTLDLADCVYAHHEKWDGTGYPKGLRGEEIPLISRIVAIIDWFEKNLLRSDNNIVTAKENALKEIDGLAGKDFDPNLAEIFIRLVKDED